MYIRATKKVSRFKFEIYFSSLVVRYETSTSGDSSQTTGRDDDRRFAETERGFVSGEVRGEKEERCFLILLSSSLARSLFFQLTNSLSLSQESFYRDCAAAGTCTSLAYVCSSSSSDDGDDENGDEFEETHRSSSSSSSFDELAGAIAVRLEKHPKMSDKARMYIMTLGVYAPHRSRGIGSRLLTNSLNEASEDENIVDAYLHVQTNNDEAIKFYCDPNGKFAFEKGEVIEKYYKRIEPDSAVVLRLDMKKWKRKEVEKARCMEYRA